MASKEQLDKVYQQVSKICDNQQQLNFADKVLFAVEKGMYTKDNYYKNLAKDCARVKSDKTIKAYQCIADFIYARLYDEDDNNV